MNAPCKDCTKRKPLCHSTCKEYLEFRAECDERSRERIKKGSIDSATYDLKESRYTHKNKE